MGQSLVYSNLHVYRATMNLLYAGAYRRRFDPICEAIGPDVTSVCELCFADVQVARYCRSAGIAWVGVDLNPRFCRHARQLGFDVIQGDLLKAPLPSADVFVMAGSLYHFHADVEVLLDRIFARTNRLLLSEPVRNLSSAAGPVGWLARRGANPGTGNAPFRFDRESLMDCLEGPVRRHGLKMDILACNRDLTLDLHA